MAVVALVIITVHLWAKRRQARIDKWEKDRAGDAGLAILDDTTPARDLPPVPRLGQRTDTVFMQAVKTDKAA